jgi:hypothetical protein
MITITMTMIEKEIYAEVDDLGMMQLLFVGLASGATIWTATNRTHQAINTAAAR